MPGPVRNVLRARINQDPVTIKNVEVSIIDRAWSRARSVRSRRVALRQDGRGRSGPGRRRLAAAQRLTRAGHTVAVYERADKMGGLLRYGVPEFDEKQHLDRRLDQMRREGTVFRAGVDVGSDALTTERLLDRYDAVVLAMGSTTSRADLPIPGRDLAGSTRRWSTSRSPTGPRSARSCPTRSAPTASTW